MRSACLLAVLAALAASPGSARAAGEACAPNLASSLASTGTAAQLVTVVGAGAASTTGTVELWTKAPAGCWRRAAGPWLADLGFAGLSAHRHEGDGTTPTGAFPIGPVIFGTAPDPGVRYEYHRLVCGDWWDEDPASPDYNSFQHIPCGHAPPFGGGSEPLWRSPVAYAHFVFVEYNVTPVVPGRGSAIFIHDEVGGPTTGCVALAPAHIVRLIRWLDPSDRPLVVIGTAAGIAAY